MSGLVFVDTNVLVYAVDAGDRDKHAAARAWRAELWTRRRGRLSFQVLHARNRVGHRGDQVVLGR